MTTTSSNASLLCVVYDDVGFSEWTIIYVIILHSAFLILLLFIYLFISIGIVIISSMVCGSYLSKKKKWYVVPGAVTFGRQSQWGHLKRARLGPRPPTFLHEASSL